MALPTIPEVLNEMRDLLQRSGKESGTLSWARLYEVSGRDRLKEPFLDELAKKAKEQSFVVHYGNTNIVIAKDYAFNPL